MPVMLATLVIWLLLLQRTDWLLLATPALLINRIAEHCMLTSVAAKKLLRQLKQLSGYCISFFGM